MNRLARLALALGIALAPLGAHAQTLQQNNEVMFQQMQQWRGLSAATMGRIRAIFAGAPHMGQGNPAVTRHPMTPDEAAQRQGGSVDSVRRAYRNARFERICGHPYEVPLYDPATQTPEDATVCAFMFEYPNVPLVYPVTWVRADQAVAHAFQLAELDNPLDRLALASLAAAHQRQVQTLGKDIAAHMGVARHQQIVDDAHMGEDLAVLEGAGDAGAGETVAGQARQFGIVETDAPGIGAVDAADAIEHRGLAGAIGADQRLQFAGLNGKTDVAQHRKAAEGQAHAVNSQSRAFSHTSAFSSHIA